MPKRKYDKDLEGFKNESSKEIETELKKVLSLVCADFSYSINELPFIPEDLKRLISERSGMIAKNLSEYMISGTRGVEALKKLFEDGLKEGWSAKKFGREIDKTFRPLETWRLERIINTESAIIFSELRKQRAESIGARLRVSTIKDKRRCRACEALDGKTFTPTIARSKVPVHPSCRCTLVYEFDSDKVSPAILEEVKVGYVKGKEKKLKPKVPKQFKKYSLSEIEAPSLFGARNLSQLKKKINEFVRKASGSDYEVNLSFSLMRIWHTSKHERLYRRSEILIASRYEKDIENFFKTGKLKEGREFLDRIILHEALHAVEVSSGADIVLMPYLEEITELSAAIMEAFNKRLLIERGKVLLAYENHCDLFIRQLSRIFTDELELAKIILEICSFPKGVESLCRRLKISRLELLPTSEVLRGKKSRWDTAEDFLKALQRRLGK
jgi:SPP1 gp7 family putative phage head morphogenesis protein